MNTNNNLTLNASSIKDIQLLSKNDGLYLVTFYPRDGVGDDNITYHEEEEINIGITAKDTDIIVGLGEICEEPDGIYLCGFTVFNEYRGRGYGRKLLEGAIKYANINKLECYADNEIALKLYHSMGFEETESMRISNQHNLITLKLR